MFSIAYLSRPMRVLLAALIGVVAWLVLLQCGMPKQTAEIAGATAGACLCVRLLVVKRLQR